MPGPGRRLGAPGGGELPRPVGERAGGLGRGQVQAGICLRRGLPPQRGEDGERLRGLAARGQGAGEAQAVFAVVGEEGEEGALGGGRRRPVLLRLRQAGGDLELLGAAQRSGERHRPLRLGDGRRVVAEGGERLAERHVGEGERSFERDRPRQQRTGAERVVLPQLREPLRVEAGRLRPGGEHGGRRRGGLGRRGDQPEPGAELRRGVVDQREEAARGAGPRHGTHRLSRGGALQDAVEAQHLSLGAGEGQVGPLDDIVGRELRARRGEGVAAEHPGRRREGAGELERLVPGDQAQPLAGGGVGAHHLGERRGEPRRVAAPRQVGEAPARRPRRAAVRRRREGSPAPGDAAAGGRRRPAAPAGPAGSQDDDQDRARAEQRATAWAAARRRSGDRGGLLSRLRLRGAGALDGRQEAVAGPRHRLDPFARRALAVARRQGAADQPDVLREGALLHHRVGPQTAEQLLLGDQVPGPLDQIEQGVESARLQRHGDAVGEQAALAGVERVAAEAVGPGFLCGQACERLRRRKRERTANLGPGQS